MFLPAKTYLLTLYNHAFGLPSGNLKPRLQLIKASSYYIHVVNLFDQPLTMSREELVSGRVEMVTWTWEPLGGSQEQETAELGIEGSESLGVRV